MINLSEPIMDKLNELQKVEKQKQSTLETYGDTFHWLGELMYRSGIYEHQYQYTVDGSAAHYRALLLPNYQGYNVTPYSWMHLLIQEVAQPITIKSSWFGLRRKEQIQYETLTLLRIGHKHYYTENNLDISNAFLESYVRPYHVSELITSILSRVGVVLNTKKRENRNQEHALHKVMKYVYQNVHTQERHKE